MWPEEIGLKVLVAALGFVIISGTSFIGGCEYKEKQEQKKALAEEKANARVEKKDATQGAATVTQFKATEASYQQGYADAIKKAAGKPIIITRTKIAECSPEVSANKDLETPKESVDEKLTEVAAAYFSPDFMQLYDSTAQPGNAELRTRTYAAADAITVDEGSKVITENNATCAGYIHQLDTLITRIEQKQKLSKEQ